MVRVYISGGMSGYSPEEYKERFKMAEDLLRAHGYDVINPVNIINEKLPYTENMKMVLSALMTCDNIYFLPDSILSEGCILENNVAKGCGITEINSTISKELFRTWNINQIPE